MRYHTIVLVDRKDQIHHVNIKDIIFHLLLHHMFYLGHVRMLATQNYDPLVDF